MSDYLKIQSEHFARLKDEANRALFEMELEDAVVEAAVRRRESELQLGEVLWEWDNDLEKAVDALMKARDEGTSYPPKSEGQCHWESGGKIYAPSPDCEHVKRGK